MLLYVPKNDTLSLPTNNDNYLQLDWDADYADVSGTNLNVLYDLSPNRNHGLPSGTNAVEVVSNDLNGYSSLKFDGTNWIISTLNALPSLEAFVCFIVLKLDVALSETGYQDIAGTEKDGDGTSSTANNNSTMIRFQGNPSSIRLTKNNDNNTNNDWETGHPRDTNWYLLTFAVRLVK